MKITRWILLLDLILLLFWLGCSEEVSIESRHSTTDTNSPGFTQIDYKNGAYGYQATVAVITNSGHRFAVAHSSSRVSICEVTDASLVETNK